MARSTVTRQAIPVAGLNITDMTYDTLGVGANNGVVFAYNLGDLILLRNTTGASVNYTLKVPAPASLSAVGATVGDVTVAVAAAKTVTYKANAAFRQSDGNIYIDCSAAGTIAVLAAQDT